MEINKSARFFSIPREALAPGTERATLQIKRTLPINLQRRSSPNRPPPPIAYFHFFSSSTIQIPFHFFLRHQQFPLQSEGLRTMRGSTRISFSCLIEIKMFHDSGLDPPSK